MEKRFVIFFVDAALRTDIDIASRDGKDIKRSSHPSF